MGILNLLPKRFTTADSGVEDHRDVSSLAYEESPKGKDPFMGNRPIKGNHTRPPAITEVLAAATAPSPHVPHGPRSNLEQQIIYKGRLPLNREAAFAFHDNALKTLEGSNPHGQPHSPPPRPLRPKKSDPLLQRPNGLLRQSSLRRSSSEIDIYAQANRHSNNPTAQASHMAVYMEHVADRNMDLRKRIHNKPAPLKKSSRYSNAHLFYPQIAELNFEHGDGPPDTLQRGRPRSREKDPKNAKLPNSFRGELPPNGSLPIKDKPEQARKARRTIVLRNRKDPSTLDRGNRLPRKYIDCSPVSSKRRGRNNNGKDSDNDSQHSSSSDSAAESLFDRALSDFPLPPSHRPMSHQFPIPSPSPNPMSSIPSQPQRFSTLVQRPFVRGVMDGNGDNGLRHPPLLRPNPGVPENRHSLSSPYSPRPSTFSGVDRFAQVAPALTTTPTLHNSRKEEISRDTHTHHTQPIVDVTLLPKRHRPQQANGSTLQEIAPRYPYYQRETIEKVSETTDDFLRPSPTTRTPEIVLQRSLTPSPPNTAARPQQQRGKAVTEEDTGCVPPSRALTSAKAHRRLEIPPARVPRRRSSIREQVTDVSRHSLGRRTALSQVREGGEGQR